MRLGQGEARARLAAHDRTVLVAPELNERRHRVIAGNCHRLLPGDPLNQVVDKGLGFSFQSR